jgi:hypothetical protein
VSIGYARYALDDFGYDSSGDVGTMPIWTSPDRVLQDTIPVINPNTANLPQEQNPAPTGPASFEDWLGVLNDSSLDWDSRAEAAFTLKDMKEQGQIEDLNQLEALANSFAKILFDTTAPVDLRNMVGRAIFESIKYGEVNPQTMLSLTNLAVDSILKEPEPTVAIYYAQIAEAAMQGLNNAEWTDFKIEKARQLKAILPKIEEDNRLTPAVEAIRSAIAASPNVPEPVRQEIIQEQTRTVTNPGATEGEKRAAADGLIEYYRNLYQQMKENYEAGNQVDERIYNQLVEALKNELITDPALRAKIDEIIRLVAARIPQAVANNPPPPPAPPKNDEEGVPNRGTVMGGGLSNRSYSQTIATVLSTPGINIPDNFPLPPGDFGDGERNRGMAQGVQQIYERQMANRTSAQPGSGINPPGTRAPEHQGTRAPGHQGTRLLECRFRI